MEVPFDVVASSFGVNTLDFFNAGYSSLLMFKTKASIRDFSLESNIGFLASEKELKIHQLIHPCMH